MKKIISIEITNSSFFEETFHFKFSEKLNCIMGGRGTGKSTILQFIKAATEIDAEINRDTFNILKNNLDGGKITIVIEGKLGNQYRIEKIIGEEPQSYFNSNGNFISFDSLLKEIACDIFPAQHIEDIGRNSDERLKLIDKMLFEEYTTYTDEIYKQRIELEKNAKDIRTININLLQKKEKLKEYGAIDEELKTHRESIPTDININEKVEFEKHDLAEKTRLAESRYLNKLHESFSSLSNQQQELNDLIEKITLTINDSSNFINKELIENLKSVISKSIKQIQSNNTLNNSNITEVIAKVGETQTKIKELHSIQHNEFVQLKQNLDKHKVFYDKLNILTKRLDEKNNLISEIKELEDRRATLKASRSKLMQELISLKNKLYDKRLEKINELNEQFEGGRIKITLNPGGITNEYEDALRNALKGHNLRYNTLIPYLVSNFTPNDLAATIHEKNIEKLKEVSGIDIERSSAILNALYETEAIYNIETIYCPDLPDFHLKVDKQDNLESKSVDNYKKSDELSTGQRCTTVLPIIFAISQNPLIIDQPEDNLDNKYITETIKNIIKKLKGRRQLIFITHNPNIPVLSESENNVFLKYEDKKTSILKQGDVFKVKSEILSLLEGGKEAFDLRDTLYKNENSH